MNDDERMASVCRIGMGLMYVEQGLEMLTAAAAQVSGEQAQRVIAAVEKFGAARRKLVNPAILQPGSDARN